MNFHTKSAEVSDELDCATLSFGPAYERPVVFILVLNGGVSGRELGVSTSALWFNRGMGPKIQRFICAVISP